MGTVIVKRSNAPEVDVAELHARGFTEIESMPGVFFREREDGTTQTATFVPGIGWLVSAYKRSTNKQWWPPGIGTWAFSNALSAITYGDVENWGM